jgi:hypothetical protein
VKITKDYTLAAADALATLTTAPAAPFHFVFVSGEGVTHTPGRFTPIFSRVKGETELALSARQAASSSSSSSAPLRVTTVRPAMVDGGHHAAIQPFLPIRPLWWRAAERALRPVVDSGLFKASHSPTQELGEFLMGTAMGRFDGRLSGPGVIDAGGMPVVENVAFRRLMGL